MKNVALVDIDNSEKVSFPNLVLMKASTHYKSIGYNVKLIHGELLDLYNKEYEKGIPAHAHSNFYPDIVIKSKVFTWSKDKNVMYKEEYNEGGTGIDISKKLHTKIDKSYPDYDLYKGLYHKRQSKFENVGMGFITRGCYRKCSFCFVPKKEGMIHEYMKIEDFKKPDSDNLILLDNNIIAHSHGRREIQRMKDMGLYVDFNQGLDPHIISSREWIAELLSGLNWIHQVRLACDEQNDKEALKKSVELLRKYKCKGRIFSYSIITPDVEESYDRIRFIDSLDVIPYSQSLRDKFNTPPSIYMQVLQQWVSSAISGRFFALSFEDYLNIMLVYNPFKKRFIDIHMRDDFRENWNNNKIKNKRNMNLRKSIKELVDEKILNDTKYFNKERIKELEEKMKFSDNEDYKVFF